MVLSKKTYKISNTIFLLLIFTYLSYAYSHIHDVYAYENFGYDFKTKNLIIASLLLLSSLLFLNLSKLNSLTYAISVIIKVLILIPSLVLYGFMNTKIEISLLIFLFDFLIIITGFVRFKPKSQTVKKQQHIPFLILLSLLMLIPFFITFGFDIDFDLLKLKGIYKHRLEVREQSNLFTSYFTFWLSKVIIPILLALGILYKKHFATLMGILVMLYIFLITGGHKSIFFSLFVVISFSFFNNYYKKIFFFLLGFVFILLICKISTSYNYELINDLVVRRTLFVPSVLDSIYFEFFKDNHMYLSHSILSPFIDNPYEIQPSFIIGEKYYDNIAANAGNGIISDGYMNFGITGVFISISIAVFIIVWLKSLDIHPVFFGVFFMIIYGFTSTGILTNLLTGGIILIVIVSQFLLKNSKYENT